MSDFLFTTTTMNQTPLPVSSSAHHDDNDGSFGGDVENPKQQFFIMSSVVDGQSFNFHLLQQLFAFIGVVATVISAIAVLYYYYLHYFKISSSSRMIDDDKNDENTKPVQEKVLESSTSTNNNDANKTAPSSLPSFHIRSFETLFATQQQSVQYFFDNVNMKQFEHVNRILLQCSNNNHLVHFCGVGKSGVVAQKLAVTLTSTGTRSLYLNPTDALHGDLGMVQEGDVVVLISKSGESDELVKLMPFLNNRLSSSSSSCIAMVSNKHSRLAKLCGESNILEMPMLQELCPFNMVPTTSVALQMIMGDVLAVSLMEHKQVHLDQFAKNHPAGRIGKRLCLKVRDVMMKVVAGQQEQQQSSNMKNVDFVVDVDMLAYDAMKMMKEKSMASLPVVDSRREENENVVGVLRLQDLVQAGL